MAKTVKDFFPRLRPKITVEQDSTPALTLDVARDESDLLKNAEETPVYAQILDGLTLKQRNLLRAIAVAGGQGIFSEDFRRSNDLGAASTVSISVKLLRNKELLDAESNRYYIPDVFLKQWIRQNLQ